MQNGLFGAVYNKPILFDEIRDLNCDVFYSGLLSKTKTILLFKLFYFFILSKELKKNKTKSCDNIVPSIN